MEQTTDGTTLYRPPESWQPSAVSSAPSGSRVVVMTTAGQERKEEEEEETREVEIRSEMDRGRHGAPTTNTESPERKRKY